LTLHITIESLKPKMVTLDQYIFHVLIFLASSTFKVLSTQALKILFKRHLSITLVTFAHILIQNHLKK